MQQVVQNKVKIEDTIAQVLKLAKQQGADSAQATVSTGSGFTVAVRMGEVETIEHHRDKAMEVTLYFGKKSGTASTSDLTEESLRAVVEKAANIAKFTSEDPCAGLAEKSMMAFDYPNLDLYHPWNITPEQGIALALQCEQIARTVDKRISNSEGATLNTYQSLYAYGNSHGFIGSYPSSRHTLSCALIAHDGHGMQRDYDYVTGRDPQDLGDVSTVARRAASRTVRRLGAKKISTRRCPVIFSPELARSLLGSFIAAISGGNLYRKASFLVDQLNQKIFPEYIDIIEQPHLLKALGSAPFDQEGVRTWEKPLVQQGILKSYVLGSYSARKLGMQSTGNSGGVHNVLLNSTGLNFDELLHEMGSGLLITELMGQGLNLVTGDYSRGAFGYWVEHGEIRYPVQEITVAGNLKEMLKNIIATGNDIDYRGSIHSGSILIKEMTIAGE